jgi:uncharacterized protein (DUF2147 family)
MRHDLPSTKSPARWAKAVVALFAGLSAGAAEASPPTEMGVWINHTGKGAVEIRPCAASGPTANRLCGFIVWLKEPNGRNGQPLTDAYNPDPAKRKRTICGMPVLGSLQRVSSGYDNGWVYDPEQGAQFDAAIVAGKTQLVLTGYKGVKFFSKSFNWHRAPADLPRCDQAAAAQATPAKATSADMKIASPQQQPQMKVPRPVPAIRPTVQ